MTEQIINVERIEHMVNLFGSLDENIKLLEREYGVNIVCRDTELKICGEAEAVLHANAAVEALLQLAVRGEQISQQNVHYVISLVRDGQQDKIAQMGKDVICVTTKGRPVKAKTVGQQKYVEAIQKNIVTLGIGPAGTGKTYTAIALAVRSLKNREVKRLILTRPAVEAGERLGFLPGDLKDKLDPYLQPLYDALQDMVPAQRLKSYMEDGTIQIAPLAYMRGRTLESAFVILDEAQNTNLVQLKMFLTRMGNHAKFIVIGDITQIDLPNKGDSGLKRAMEILKGIPGISYVNFTKEDIVRHPLVTKIVKAFEGNE